MQTTARKVTKADYAKAEEFVLNGGEIRVVALQDHLGDVTPSDAEKIMRKLEKNKIVTVSDVLGRRTLY